MDRPVPKVVITVVKLDPNQIGMCDFNYDGTIMNDRIVGRKKGQQLLFEEAVAGSIIYTFHDEPDGVKRTLIEIYDRERFNEYKAQLVLEQLTPASPDQEDCDG